MPAAIPHFCIGMLFAGIIYEADAGEWWRVAVFVGLIAVFAGISHQISRQERP
jgi:hypothetical protein